MVRTTPPRPITVTEVFPELSAYKRTAIRLHPRPGASSADESSMGGPLLWPAGEPWPHCTRDHEDEAGPVALLPVLQVYARDVPELPGWDWPEGTDLLQVLWCPNDHRDPSIDPWYEGPIPTLFWRRSADVQDVLHTPPASRFACDPEYYHPADDWYTLTPCVIHPEAVAEYPDAGEVPKELALRIHEWEEFSGPEYQYELSISPGCKVGGWPTWHLTDFHAIDCPCGARMQPLLTIASSEWHGGGESWIPVEDHPDTRDSDPLGIDVGRYGQMRVFACPTSLDHPIRLDTQ
ncbi:hypothetical protein [Yinghuangia seranimata]|uniref:hypothetical protein n=1 Tax=Yinghuangia seranimata TaxID=408067 RepID=UPI00248BD026|nr:hypothetical protein [Yinghuangia seranimata]MDI2128324.1 hypothetical protein [Yinghuangia seranimata]